ncbi:MAG TPA: 2-dehydropantoate 2-reductase [Desulfatiglandales bacterium]|nr:2-dehydropantoate 2-reductase [Desulfatiglandales bacterium]
MGDIRFAVVGIGATGSVMAAALLSRDPETLLVGTGIAQGKALRENGIRVSGALSYEVPVRNYIQGISGLKDFSPNVVLIATKTFHLETVLDGLKDNIGPDTKIISSHNGLGPEDRIAELFGPDAAFRMSLNYGASLKGFGEAEVAFFNRPNHLGALSEMNRETGLQIAALLTDAGLFTEYIDDIRLYVWRKMIMKCTMASICAVTGMTIKEALDFSPSREIADACFKEALDVARAMGYDLGEDYMEQAMKYLEKVGMHKDSMCYDIANRTPTEIDFLGGKIVEYALQKGIPTPFYVTMTHLVKAMEAGYLSERV